jgi:multicomponent Na+:H+ antiporter subunit F
VTAAFLIAALFLLLNVAVGLVRVLRGPTTADSMLAAQLFGTTTVAVLLLLAPATGDWVWAEVALALALLAAVATVAFVVHLPDLTAGFGEPDPEGGRKEDHGSV